MRAMVVVMIDERRSVGRRRDGWMLTTQPLPDIYVASGGREEPLEA
jgi:hypothetical protein